MKIAMHDVQRQYAEMREVVNARIQRVLDHGQFIMGPEVAELEGRLAEFTGAPHAITCASGTEAMLIALMALDVKPGDEVVTTPFSFIATAEVIVLAGATPVFVDVEPDTCNIDPRKLAAALTARTRAIMPVSLYGQPADMDEINAVAERHGVPVIEDAAQSFGALYRGRRSGNLSTIGCTSFFPTKPLGCYGDGGAIFTGDAALAQAMREIRVHGQSKRYVHTRVGVGGVWTPSSARWCWPSWSASSGRSPTGRRRRRATLGCWSRSAGESGCRWCGATAPACGRSTR